MKCLCKSFLALLLCLTLITGIIPVLSEEEPLSGVSDNKPPVFSNINIAEKGKTLHVGDVVHFSVHIEDSSELDYADVRFWSPDGAGDFTVELTYNPATDQYEAEKQLTSDMHDGEYMLDLIYAYDEFRNYMQKGGTDYGTFTLEGFQGKVFDSSTVFCVLSENGRTIKPGDTIHVSVDIKAEVENVHCYLFREDDINTEWNYLDLAYNGKTKIYEGEYGFSDRQANGKYRLYSIEFELQSNGQHIAYYPEDCYVVLTGASDDKSAPVIQSVSFAENGKTLGVGDTLHVKVEVQDESDIDRLYVYFSGPETSIPDDEHWDYDEYLKNHEYSGTWSNFWFDNMQETSKNVWEGTTTLDVRTPNDKYNLSSIEVTDKAGNVNYQSYGTDQFWFRFDGPEAPPRGIYDFVTRCYYIILGRAPDVSGQMTWIDELSSGRKAAAEIIEQFVSSDEFKNQKNSNDYAVEVLYNAMLDRNSDAAGKASWVEKLNAGEDLTAVINGFCGSAEFKAICDAYNIKPGTVTVKPGTPAAPDASSTDDDKIKAYVERCYQIILGRGADEGGLNTWVNELNSGRKAAAEIIEQFVASAEFQNKNLSNSDSVEILYKAMLGRGSDPAGKASWVKKLDEGQDLTAVINGFCGSAEFKAICDSYGIQPGTVTVKQPTAPTANDEKIKAFVARCYKIILGRDADEGGMNTWFNELKSGRKAAAEIIESFVNSQEFQNKKYSNADAVEILYKAMLGRGSDPAGKADWVAKLNNGQPLEAVINGFCGSAEFKAICNAYGITPGTVNVPQLSKIAVMQEVPTEKPVVKETVNNVTKVEITNASDTVNENLGTAVQAIYINEEKAKEFVGRCYRVILGREASQAELDSWIGQMMNGSKTADQIARGFLFSGEFKGRNIGNEELVKILYRVYMNREADAEGLATWTQKLDEGTSLNDLLDIFSKTNEFKAVVSNMAQ